jgi:hypothetical protein
MYIHTYICNLTLAFVDAIPSFVHFHSQRFGLKNVYSFMLCVQPFGSFLKILPIERRWRLWKKGEFWGWKIFLPKFIQTKQFHGLGWGRFIINCDWVAQNGENSIRLLRRSSSHEKQAQIFVPGIKFCSPPRWR